jgi:predicted O-methyltransferase YrrM
MFVEIGIFKGGLASLLMARALYDHEFKYLGVEIDVGQTEKSVLEMASNHPRAMILSGDCFDHKIKGMVERDIKNGPAPALIFCDGGDKPKELDCYHEVLRPGDFILIHDYSREKIQPEKISYEDVEPVLIKPEFFDARPEHWDDKGMFLIGRK